MSSLFKLSIQGIRSFDSERQETIQFGFPLTLICGQNGCGKTTIIECLKYATTGDLPPNSKGGAFINDPTIANRNIVNGQIKLAFKSVNDKSMIVNRTMQLTKKRGRGGASSNTFKTLEGQLSVMSKGVKTSVSSKNAELDVSVPMYLGASRAILDYVIFCHQDDSLWPLSEASVLKKRFDDIFEALKFTKVLDGIKVIRKDMATEIKLVEQSVQHLKIDKNRAKKISDKLRENEEKVEIYTSEIADLTLKIEEYEKQANNLFESNQHYQETLSEHQRLNDVRANLARNVERLKGSIQYLNDSDEELSYKLANSNELHIKKKTQLEGLEKSNKDLVSKNSQVQSDFNNYTRIEGSLANKKQIYDMNIQKVDQYMQIARDKYEIEIDAEHTNSKQLQMIEALDTELKVLGSKFKRSVENYKQQIQDSDNKVREVRDSITKEKQHDFYCNEDINNATLKIRDLKKKLTTLQYDESSLEMERTELESLKLKYDAKRNSSNVKEIEQSIQSDNARLVSLEHELDDITKKITLSNKQSDLHARLSLQKEAYTSKKDTLDRLISLHSGAFREQSGQDFNLDTCDSVLRDLVEKVSQDVEDHQNELTVKISETNSVKATVKSYQSELKKNQNLISELKQKILRVIEEDEIPEYEKIVNELEEDHTTTLHNLNTFDVTKEFKIRAIEIAKTEKCCTLCRRPVEGDFLNEFITLLKESVNEMSVEKLKENVNSTKTELENIKSINSDITLYRISSREVNDLTSRIEQEIAKIGEADKAQEGVAQQVETLKSTLDSLHTLRNSVNNILRLKDETNEINQQLSNTEDALADYGASTISATELQKLQQEKNSEMRNLRQKISDDVESKYLQQKELTRLDINIKDKNLHIANLEKSLSEITNIKTSIADFETHIASLKQKKANLEIILNDLSKKYHKATSDFNDLSHELKAREDEESIRLKEFESFRNEYIKKYEIISEFENKDTLLIEENSKKLEEVRNLLQEIGNKRQHIQNEVRLLQYELNEAVSIERNIRDNIELRDTEKEIGTIIEQISSLDIESAAAEKSKYQSKSKAIRDRLSDLNAQHAGKVGEIKQIKDQIKQFNDDLNHEFKDVNKLYHEEWVKLQTNLLVSNDLLTYSKALDNAIMKYHSAKMEDINRILRELWNQTYKGSDIDTIEIKSDVNTQAKGNRSYNYRVVMYKMDAELDMRGRCSAGQKVLTSILIRLALAECFGSNCGMIALDEPTTNLDSDNAESLALALNNIIEFRKNQKNFQLIVITHDEKFLSNINGDKFTDHFYRVQRDELQKSAIRSLPIHLIQDE